MKFLIFITLGVLLACVCEGFTLDHELDRTHRKKHWEDEHTEHEKPKEPKEKNGQHVA